MKVKARPFIKWVGGKGQLLAQFENYFPSDLRGRKLKRYCEPFLGGGAVFFEIMQRFSVESAYLSDVNKDLVLTYWVIQQKHEQLLDFLEQYQKEYDTTHPEQRNELFLSIRDHFNKQRFEINYKKMSENWMPRAAQLIFLNKTCFNGLFRINSKGEFNVPYGKYPNPSILDEQNIQAVSNILQRAEIAIAQYDECFDKIDNQTFVYFDPPYRPLNKTASFTSYSVNEFGDKEQVKLANFFRMVDAEKGGKVMLSNSDPKNENPNDDFFENIYSNYNIYRVSANRAINCNGEKRGAIKEIVVTNYKYEPQALEFDF
jgi:DNA adenine methylase